MKNTKKNTFLKLTDEMGLIIDGCGKSYDEKFYYNGTYIDLCGLSPEEYMKTHFCCGGESNNNPSTPSKVQNKITVHVTLDEDNEVIYYQAFASFPVTSNIKVSVSSLNNIVTELDIFAGEKQSLAEVGETLEITSVSLDTTEDDNYKYEGVIGGELMEYNIYFGTLLKSELNKVNEILSDFESLVMTLNTTVDATFVVPATDVNYNNVSDEEFNDFCQKNQYSFVIVLPTEIYVNKQYFITNYNGDNIKAKFVNEGSLSILGKEYTILAEYGTDDITPFVPLYNEENTFTYKFSLIN
jgi:hypothetical protein